MIISLFPHVFLCRWTMVTHAGSLLTQPLRAGGALRPTRFIMSIFSRQHLRLPLVHWNQVVPRPEARQAPTTRDIDCPHCGGTLRVAIRAINTRCTSCHKHLRLEDVVLRGDSPLTRVV